MEIDTTVITEHSNIYWVYCKRLMRAADAQVTGGFPCSQLLFSPMGAANKGGPTGGAAIWEPTHSENFCWYDCERIDMGVSENSVPLNPMVNDHYPY